MTERTTQHDTFVIKRTYAVAPARVFGAWAEPTAKARWFRGSEGSHSDEHELDFRVGGRERLRTAAPGGLPHIFDCRYCDIVPNQRIVYCYDLVIGEARISVSLATVEFEAIDGGTRMTFTEQVVFLDGYDDAGRRERGSAKLFDQLEASLTQAPREA
jgi:uncharacterized protein YndB with AHSA1/START domain